VSGVVTPAVEDGVLHAEARAKINLTLDVLGRRADGYHELASLVAFATTGDRLRLRPGSAWSLSCSGPSAHLIDGENILERTARAVLAVWPDATTGQLELYKSLPVAAGIGGGSADAAALLALVRQANGDRPSPPDWASLARTLGADVPVCLVGRLAVMRGMGERITPLALKARLPAVLVNPRLPLPTAAVFADLAAPTYQPLDADTLVPAFAGVQDLLDWVRAGRNDLEASALRLVPTVGRVRAALQSQPGCQVARLSGSGPTCFGLFDSPVAADLAAADIRRTEPDWWVEATELS
jgi:4-diphosphocytidyl-2-C-methyl-D-erythritol kinase